MMGVEKSKLITAEELQNLFKKGTIFTYNEGCELETVSKEDIRTRDYIENLISCGNIVISDMFILEALNFYKHAVLDMVVSYLDSLKKKYPQKNIVSGKAAIEARMNYLSNNGFLLRRKIMAADNVCVLTVYSINSNGSTVYREKLDKGCWYETFYNAHPTSKVMRLLHSAKVSTVISMNDFCTDFKYYYNIKTNPQTTVTTQGYLKIQDKAEEVHMFVEALHFKYDRRLETEEERFSKNVKRINELMWIKKKYVMENKRVAFVFCVEDWDALKKIVEITEPVSEYFDGCTYITTDRILYTVKNDLKNAFIKLVRTDGKWGLRLPKVEEEWFR